MPLPAAETTAFVNDRWDRELVPCTTTSPSPTSRRVRSGVGGHGHMAEAAARLEQWACAREIEGLSPSRWRTCPAARR